MSVTRLFNHARVLWQTADYEHGMAEPAIGASVDNGGIIVLEQEDRRIVLNRASVPDLCRLLRDLAKDGAA